MQINLSLNNCQTKPGEIVRIAGNLPQLGSWNIVNSLKMVTSH
jgi:hypothetical protein